MDITSCILGAVRHPCSLQAMSCRHIHSLDRGCLHCRQSIVWGWDNAIWGASALLANYHSGEQTDYSREIERALGNWMYGRNGTIITPKGLAWSNDWGTLRNAANAGQTHFSRFFAERPLKGRRPSVEQKRLLESFSIGMRAKFHPLSFSHCLANSQYSDLAKAEGSSEGFSCGHKFRCIQIGPTNDVVH